MSTVRIVLVIGILAALPACENQMEISDFDVERASDPAAAAEAELRTSDVYDAQFYQAAREFNVPAAVLKSIAYVNTRYEMVKGEDEFEGEALSLGVMGLKDTQLEQAAQLAGISTAEAEGDVLGNIRASAALLSAHADELAIAREDVRNWAPVIAKFSALVEPTSQQVFVRDEVFSALKLGVGKPSKDLGLTAQDLELSGEFGTLKQELTVGPDYPKAVWRKSNNVTSGRTQAIKMVIIHTCEGGYSGCVDTLINSSKGVSAHYVVNSTGSEVAQLVREKDTARHISATYECSRNSSKYCSLNGVGSNRFTIGIEHSGYGSQSSWPAGQISASAELVCDITKDNNIARDRYHIVGHGQLQPYNRSDPGPNWPWTSYIQQINTFCGGSNPNPNPPPSTGGLVIDSNNSNNDQTKGYIQLSANWTSASSTPGFYGTGYFYAQVSAVSDGAAFWFYNPTAGSKTIDAWWTAGSNRSTATPFVMLDATGAQVGKTTVNQQVNGNKWNVIGTYNFPAGWNKVVVSRWASGGSVVVADAIRVR